jgi:hypothetical protein
MKGQSVLIVHTVLLAASIAFILIVVATFVSLKDTHQELIAENELSEICILTRGAIEKIYQKSDYISPTKTELGRIEIALPENIADLSYRINFTGNKLEIHAGRFNETCVVGLNATLKGSSSGSSTEIIFRKYSNGTEEVELKNI